MFTGIIETLGKLEEIRKEGQLVHLTFSSSISGELKVDQSVSHNGVCLTVVNTSGNRYTVTLIPETLKRSNLGEIKPGELVNLERCLPVNGRFDGHIVQGHVDVTGICTELKVEDGTHEYFF